MEYFQSLELTLEGSAALLFGVIVVLMFSIHEFPRQTFSPLQSWPESPLTLSDLTSRRDYLVSFLLYLAGLEFLFLVVCLVGPVPFAEVLPASSEVTTAPQSEGSFPLWVALALVGVMPRVPLLRDMERTWRQLLQKRAAIPSAAVLLSRRLRRSMQNLSPLRHAFEQNSEPYGRYVEEEDFNAPEGTLLYHWNRLSSILIQIDTIQINRESDDLIESEFIVKYKREFDIIKTQYHQIGDKISALRQISSDGSGLGSDFHDRTQQEIVTIFDRCCILLSCAILAKRHNREQQDKALTEMGFLVDQPSRGPTTQGLMKDIDVIALGFFLALVICFVATLLAPLLTPIIPSSFDGWPNDADTLNAAQWAGSFLFVHGGALAAGFAIRVRYMNRGYGLLGGRSGNRYVPNFLGFVAIGILSALTAFVLYCYWDAAWRSARIVLAEIHLLAPVGLVGSCTAIFVIKILDFSRNENIARGLAKLVVAQIFVTAAVQGLALFHYFDNRNETNEGGVAFGVVMVAIFSLVLGTWLARDKLGKLRKAEITEPSGNPEEGQSGGGSRGAI